jgi:primosomal protein N' (replication factor Y)
VLHSALPPRERLAAWRRLRAGEVGIALGARSAVFAPVRALGVVVVDEEHDPSFKQEEGVRYHGRDLAVVRAQRAGAIAILGSATPSLESTFNVTRGRFTRLLLPERATPRPLPEVTVIDLRRHPPGPDGLLSAQLADALGAALAAGEQSILFLNRRGFSTLLLCHACGHVVRCPNCAVSMTYHRGRSRLVCHYCGRLQHVPERCPSCGSPRMERMGIGTEHVESIVRDRFPTRASRGSTATPPANGPPRAAAWTRSWRACTRRDRRLVGTQMVTKGHDFPGRDAGGRAQARSDDEPPRFRAAERTFQLIEQVAGGRARRSSRARDHPDLRARSPAIVAAAAHDYEGFARHELAGARRPPTRRSRA